MHTNMNTYTHIYTHLFQKAPPPGVPPQPHSPTQPLGLLQPQSSLHWQVSLKPRSPQRPWMSPLLVFYPMAADGPAAFLHSHNASPTPRTSPGALLHGLGTSLHSISSPMAAELRAWTCWALHSDLASLPLARPCAAWARPHGQSPCS